MVPAVNGIAITVRSTNSSTLSRSVIRMSDFNGNGIVAEKKSSWEIDITVMKNFASTAASVAGNLGKNISVTPINEVDAMMSAHIRRRDCSSRSPLHSDAGQVQTMNRFFTLMVTVAPSGCVEDASGSCACTGHSSDPAPS